MEVYLFRSELDPNVSAFAPDSAGKELPAEYRPWKRSGNRTISLIAAPGDMIAQNVNRRGYHLLIKPRVTH